uniref:Uncharacterized protein n=1 Tax=Physcomitrium patens TaxID=3218 RepID=A0A7I3ZRX4_PHYPA
MDLGRAGASPGRDGCTLSSCEFGTLFMRFFMRLTCAYVKHRRLVVRRISCLSVGFMCWAARFTRHAICTDVSAMPCLE